MNLIAERLRDARKQIGLTQIQVMERTNINHKTLSGYENGVSEPDLETVMILAKLYNVTTDYLLGRTNIPNPSPKPLTLEEEPTHQDLEEFLHTSNVQFNGAPLDEKDKEEIIDVLKYVWKRLRKDKDTPENK